MKKRIAFVTPLYLPANISGSQMFVKTLAEVFAQKGYEVTVISSNALTPRYWYDPFFGKKLNNSYEVIHGVSVYRLSTAQLWSSCLFILARLFPTPWLKMMSSGPFFLGLDRILKKMKFDVIHCSPFPLGMNKQVVQSIQRLTYKPKLYITPFFHTHGKGFHNLELQSIFDAADIIHVISQAEKTDITSSFMVDAKKIHIAPLCIDTQSMVPYEYLREDIAKIQKKFTLQHKKIILFAGIKGKGKGVLDVLQAVHELWQKDPSFLFIAIGSSTAEWQEATRHVHSDCYLDLPYKTGREKEAFFALADLYCMPSCTETFGLTYIEAWHKRKPVIGADFPSVHELIIKNSGGITVPYGDTDALKIAITKLIQNPVLSKKLGNNGYNALMKRYTLSGVLPKYLRLFEGVNV